MKNTYCMFFVFLFCNISFSQQEMQSIGSANEHINTGLFKFYPNPVEKDLFVLGTDKIKSIEIIDVLGKPVVKYLFNKRIIKIDVSQLKSGIYLLQVINKNNQQETKKFIVK